MNKIRKKVIWISLLVGDFFIFYGSLYLALFLRRMSVPEKELFEALQEPFFYLFLIWVFIFFILDFYEPSSQKKEFLKNIIVFTLLAISTGTVYFYFQPQLEVTPRAILFLTIANFALGASLWRFLFFRLAGLKNFRKKVFIVGFCEEMKEILKKESSDHEIVGIYTEEKVKEAKVFNNFSEVKEVSREVEMIVFSPDLREDKDIIKKVFNSFPLDVKYIEFFNFYEEITQKAPLRSLNEWWFLENISKPKNKVNEIIKRIFEFFVSIIGILLFLVVAPVIMLVIKIDSKGEIFFKQKRVGEGGKPFVLYKFRTMHESLKKEDVPWREEDKSQITRVGKFLRATHLDELPQLFNIMKGDIGFVGPRPEILSLAEKFEKEIPFYKLRYLVRPGLTGWAQIKYPPSKNVKEAEEKFKYDLYYIKNRSFFFDLVIILKTGRTIF